MEQPNSDAADTMSTIDHVSRSECGGEHPNEQPIHVVDIGINLTNKAFRNNWKDVVRRAIDAGVHRILLTGTSIESSKESLVKAREWYETEGGIPNLFATVGVHPHDAKSWNENSSARLRKLLADPFAVAVGECGLDYNRNFSSKADQIRAFRGQLELAQELRYPIFLHEREAHNDLIEVLEEIFPSGGISNGLEDAYQPKIVVHCFTGTQEEASTYIKRGYYLGFTGTICKKERGEHLRKLIRSLPLEKVMVETDAPYMGFKTKRKNGTKRNSRCSEPADCIDVARQLSESIGRPFEEVGKTTTETAIDFFHLEAAEKKFASEVMMQRSQIVFKN